ncbi:MAG TPA: bestrophin family protein [Elainellaceae cyanobacterium]
MTLKLHYHWFQIAFQLRGSVIPAILPRATGCGALGIVVSVLYAYEVPVTFPLNSFIPDLVLGLLLVFRTNTAYERFWEGRKLWGSLINTVRNMARQIWIVVIEQEPGDRAQKIAALRLLVAFSVAIKLHLRHQPVNDELKALMSPEQYEKLSRMNHPPLEIAFWIGDYLQRQYQRDRLNVYQLSNMQTTLNSMIDVLGGCERILKTPIPLAYAIHLKQILLVYCLTLPFQMVNNTGWWTGPFAALISFIVFGVEEIGIEIEDPFGCDPNDLPLDEICKTMLRNIEDLITLAPCTSSMLYRESKNH